MKPLIQTIFEAKRTRRMHTCRMTEPDTNGTVQLNSTFAASVDWIHRQGLVSDLSLSHSKPAAMMSHYSFHLHRSSPRNVTGSNPARDLQEYNSFHSNQQKFAAIANIYSNVRLACI
jgi:hypothetical protein